MVGWPPSIYSATRLWRCHASRPGTTIAIGLDFVGSYDKGMVALVWGEENHYRPGLLLVDTATPTNTPANSPTRLASRPGRLAPRLELGAGKTSSSVA